MIYTPLTKKALALCFEAHKDQVDKSGLPYVFHPFHLAEQMEDELTTIVALLHDVVEDTSYTLPDLRKMTHQPEIAYMDYVAGLKENAIARTVKLADLRHNSDLSRLDAITDKDLARVAKYQQAIAVLEEKQE